MGWILGALGIGGIGAALFLVPGLAANALKALGAALGVVRDNPWQCAVGALLLACGGIWHIKSGQVEDANRRADKWHTAWTAMDTAQKEAMRLAVAEKAAKEAAANDITKGANDVFKPSLAAGQADTARFVRDNRCLRVTPAKGGGERPDLSGAIPVAGQPQGAGAETFVAVAESDPSICTANTLRLDNAVNVWGQDMIARGLAR